MKQLLYWLEYRERLYGMNINAYSTRTAIEDCEEQVDMLGESVRLRALTYADRIAAIEKEEAKSNEN